MQFLLLITFLYYVYSTKTIHLNIENTLLLRGPINEETTSKLIYDIHKNNSSNKILYLDTPGGMVEEGLKIINEIKNYNISCIAEKAYSMGFSIFQNCGTRYIVSNGKLMQHQMSFGISGELEKVNHYVDFIKQVEDEVVEQEANRINMNTESYRQLTTNEWWIYGKNNIKHNTADEIVNVKCSSKLTKLNFTIETRKYSYIYSSCPLIPMEIDKIEKKTKNSNSFEDLFYLI